MGEAVYSTIGLQKLAGCLRSYVYRPASKRTVLKFCQAKTITRIKTTANAMEKWTENVVAYSQGSIINEVDSWMTGVNEMSKERTLEVSQDILGVFKSTRDGVGNAGIRFTKGHLVFASKAERNTDMFCDSMLRASW